MHQTNTLFSSHHRYIWVFLCLRAEGVILVRTDSSPQYIAKEILSRLEKSSINPLYLEAPLILTEQTEEMEQQQGGNWTLEDIKGALMDDMRAIIQDELRRALTG